MEIRNIIVVVPTAAEAAHIDPRRVRLVIGGVGMAAFSATLSRLLCGLDGGSKPGMVILAGIVGAYPAAATRRTLSASATPAANAGSGLEVGESVLVAAERVADLGALRGGRFEPLYTKEYRCPYVKNFPSFKAVSANTVNCAAARGLAPAEVENMEGAAFFAICLEHGVPFLELRAISNLVGDPPAVWDIPLATRNLASALERLLNEISSSPLL